RDREVVGLARGEETHRKLPPRLHVLVQRQDEELRGSQRDNDEEARRDRPLDQRESVRAARRHARNTTATVAPSKFWRESAKCRSSSRRSTHCVQQRDRTKPAETTTGLPPKGGSDGTVSFRRTRAARRPPSAATPRSACRRPARAAPSRGRCA